MSEPLDPAMFDACLPVPVPIRFGGKWTARIIACLEGGPRRFSEIQVPLRGITPKVLTESLRAMERDGMITRTAHAEIPPRVEYELTSLGRSLLEPMAAGCAWIEAHAAELVAPRETYENRSATPA